MVSKAQASQHNEEYRYSAQKRKYYNYNKEREGCHWYAGENERDAREQKEISEARNFFLQGKNNC